ncbi:MAG: insulinase family protein [Elusimicrobia bacterium]|nr:insulinase family protein [Elusimicrobiota bacterium]
MNRLASRILRCLLSAALVFGSVPVSRAQVVEVAPKLNSGASLQTGGAVNALTGGVQAVSLSGITTLTTSGGLTTGPEIALTAPNASASGARLSVGTDLVAAARGLQLTPLAFTQTQPAALTPPNAALAAQPQSSLFRLPGEHDTARREASPAIGLMTEGPKLAALTNGGATESTAASLWNGFLRAARLGGPGDRPASAPNASLAPQSLRPNDLLPFRAQANNAPAVQPPSPGHAPETLKMITLDNGMEILIERQADVHNVDLSIAYGVGSRDESAGEEGISHYMEHLEYSGTANVKNWFRVIGALGGRQNAATTQDVTMYSHTLPSGMHTVNPENPDDKRSGLEYAIMLEQTRMGRRETTDAKVERERPIILQEMDGHAKVAYAAAQDRLRERMFVNPLNKGDIIGTKASLAAMNAEKIRRHAETFYTPRNTKVVIRGDVNVAEAERLVRRYFGTIHGRDLTDADKAKPARPPQPDLSEPAQTAEIVDSVSDPYAKRAAVHFGWKAPAAGTKEFEAAGVVATLLQRRLGIELVRKQKLALDLSMSMTHVRGPGTVSGVITAMPGVAPESLVAALDTEIAAIARGEFDERELERVLFAHAEGLGKAAQSADTLAMIAAVRGVSPAEAREQLVAEARRGMLIDVRGIQDDAASRELPEEAYDAFIQAATRRALAQARELVMRVAAESFASSGRTVVYTRTQASPQRTPDAIPDRPPAPDEAPTDLESYVLGLLQHTRWTPRPIPAASEAKLSNGAKLIVMSDPKAGDAMHAHVGFRQRSTAWDIRDKKLVPFVGKLLTQRTALRTREELEEFQQEQRISIRPRDANDHTVLEGSARGAATRTMLDLMAEMLTAPHDWTASDAELEEFKTWWKEWLRQHREDPRESTLWTTIRDILGKDHPSANATLTPDSLDLLTPAEIARLTRAHFAADNAVIVVVTALPADEVREYLEERLKAWKGSGPAPGPTAANDRLPQTAVSVVDTPGSDRAVVRVSGILAGPQNRNSPDFYAMNVANYILGDGYGARLWQGLRQAFGFAYTVGGGIVTDMANGMLSLVVETHADKARSAMDVMLSEVKGLREAPPTAIELISAKNQLVGSFVLSLNHLGTLASEALSLDLFGVPLSHFGAYPDKVMSVTAEAVRDFSGRIFDPATLGVTVAGDAHSIAPQIRHDLKDRSVNVFDLDGNEKARPKP